MSPGSRSDLRWKVALLVFLGIAAFFLVRLAKREEREVTAELGEAYRRYAAATPAFVPSLGRPSPVARAAPTIPRR